MALSTYEVPATFHIVLHSLVVTLGVLPFSGNMSFNRLTNHKCIKTTMKNSSLVLLKTNITSAIDNVVPDKERYSKPLPCQETNLEAIMV